MAWRRGAYAFERGARGYRVRVRTVWVIVLLGGCAAQAANDPLLPEVSLEEPQIVLTERADEDSRLAQPDERSTQRMAVGMDACTEVLLQVPASDAKPNADWFPPGAEPSSLLPGTYSYLVTELACRAIVVNNVTIDIDRHVMWIFTSMEFEAGHPDRTGLDYLLVSTWTDSPALAAVLIEAGLAVHAANFTAPDIDASESHVAIAGTARIELQGIGEAREGAGAVGTSPRLHAVAKNGAHIFIDLHRRAAPGFQEEGSRPGYAAMRGMAWDVATGSMQGSLRAHTLSITAIL